MIGTDQEMEATLERIRRFQTQVARLRRAEQDPVNYRLSASGFLTEIDRMKRWPELRAPRTECNSL